MENLIEFGQCTSADPLNMPQLDHSEANHLAKRKIYVECRSKRLSSVRPWWRIETGLSTIDITSIFTGGWVNTTPSRNKAKREARNLGEVKMLAENETNYAFSVNFQFKPRFSHFLPFALPLNYFCFRVDSDFLDGCWNPPVHPVSRRSQFCS